MLFRYVSEVSDRVVRFSLIYFISFFQIRKLIFPFSKQSCYNWICSSIFLTWAGWNICDEFADFIVLQEKSLCIMARVQISDHISDSQAITNLSWASRYRGDKKTRLSENWCYNQRYGYDGRSKAVCASLLLFKNQTAKINLLQAIVKIHDKINDHH